MFNELRFGSLLEVADLVSENVLDEGEVRAVLQNVLERLARFENLTHAHAVEIDAMHAAVKQIETDRVNAHTFYRQQLTATREHVDLLEQQIANLRRNRR